MEQSKEGNRIVNKERTMLSVPEGSVKRYAVFSVPPVIEEYRDGYFVNYEDYEVIKKKADALESEVHSLAAQLNFDVGNDFTQENARLKAEVERLEHESAKWRRAEHAVGDKCIEFAKTIQTLKAEVERLKQDLIAVKYYGDLMEFLKANAAKEGKPSV